jgi:serine/threonine protein kinase/Tol biopolymer transport system component
MPLLSGSRLGPYEILDLLGAGGMGEVYRARDTRLDRTVALKVLPDSLASDEPSRARLQREAKAISALNHPHICALYDLGRIDATDFLVLELLEGETLAARLSRGALPLSQVLRIGSEIADALGAAHRQGIVHRDLKPGNIMLTPTGVKLLDFGLAKPAPILPTAVTLAQPGELTVHGTIVGTLQYMAPEQVQGLEADGRTDIFALGAILHEMATGRRAFEGQGQASLIAKILEMDPPTVSSLVPVAPPALDQLVQRCLAKDAGDRWQSAHDLGLQLRWMQSQVSGTTIGTATKLRISQRRAAWLPWTVAGLCALVATGAVLLPRQSATGGIVTPMRLDLPLSPDLRLEPPDAPEISPDGRWLAYAGTLNGRRQVFRVDLSSRETAALPGTDGAFLPFWSPDSRSVAFFGPEGLKQVSVGGGSAQVLAAAPEARGGTWAPGVILFAPTPTGVIHRIADTGGPATPLTMPPPPKGGGYWLPQFLPDERTFLVWEVGARATYAGSLDRPGTLKLLNTGTGADRPVYAGGRLFFHQGTTLVARPFDARRLEFTGATVPLADSSSFFSVSAGGVVVYLSESAGMTQLTWFDREGKRTGTVGDPGYIQGISLAPSGRRAAVFRDTGRNVDLWTVDLTTGIVSRLTSDPADDTDPAWSPDERSIAFTSTRAGAWGVYVKTLVDGKEEPLTSGDPMVVDTWTPDGQSVIVRTMGRAVYAASVHGDHTPRLLVDTPYTEDELHLSPDGRWVAFNSDESGRWEVYVASFPGFTSKQQLSGQGGVQPQWRADGRELFYLALDGTMMSVGVEPDRELVARTPSPLFPTRVVPNPNLPQYAVTPDGKRFLALDAGDRRSSFTFLLNFFRPGEATTK